MKNQSYANHTRFMPAFHFVLVPLGFAAFAASIVLLFLSIGDANKLTFALMAAVLALIAVMTMIVARSFACKVQDRAIRAEQNLRHFVQTGKLLDPRLTMQQIIALRFASEEEFASLCERAFKENLSPDAIKRSVLNWKADYDRV
ncbi:DUF6526 family protein [Cohnella massiliensis]|uniref:DUF6526 family protein n=1 Tax=Cohnella massiliensis TaxID=1816691 RepID=UPI0009BB3D06|nr:DUF6526 family protein [Cohnella massiliensis]